MNFSTDSVFDPQQPGDQEAALINRFLTENDFSPNTRRAFATDLGKLSTWFVQANKEPFRISRVTAGDVSSFRDCLRRDQGQAVSTVNRALTTVAQFLHLAGGGRASDDEPGCEGEGATPTATCPDRDWIGARSASCCGRSNSVAMSGRRQSSTSFCSPAVVSGTQCSLNSMTS